MNLAAGACQGAFHCHSLKDWSPHDTIACVVVAGIILFLALVIRVVSG